MAKDELRMETTKQSLNPGISVFRLGMAGLACLVTPLMAWAAGGADSAVASDAESVRHFVMPDGRSRGMTRSSDEFGVVFDTAQDAKPAAQRMRSRGVGDLVDIELAPDARVKLLKTQDVRMQRRSVAHQDPAIREVRPVYYMDGVKAPFVSTGTINVKTQPGLDQSDIDQLWADYRVQVVDEVDGLDRVYTVKPVYDEEDEVLRAEAMALDERTEWSQPNFRHPTRRRQAAPTDEHYVEQWYLENTGQRGGSADADIDAEDAWVFSSGRDVRLGMFDDACDVDHEDLFQGFTGVGHDPSLPSTDDGFEDPRPKRFGDNHGTAVMGIAAARGNTLGVRGVAFRSEFTASRGLNEMLTFAETASVYTFARQQNVDVHINSWGFDSGTPNPAIIVDALNTAFVEGRGGLGMIVVFAAGNDGEEVEQGFELSTEASVIGVGASNIFDEVASYSNFGADIDLLAPGGNEFVGMATTDNDDERVFADDGFNREGTNTQGAPDIDPDGKYTSDFGGTSAAAPIVAGVAALILQVNPTLSATNVRIIMEHTADRISPADAQYGNITGRSLEYGYGRINAGQAIDAARDTLLNAGLTWPDLPRNVELSGSTLSWESGQGTEEFLIIESSGSFTFTNNDPDRFPVDGVCYSLDQLGCANAGASQLEALPEGVTITDVVTCDGSCTTGADEMLEGLVAGGGISYAVYSRSGIGRYSWGVEAEVVEDSDGGDDPGMEMRGPRVTIRPSLTEGVSPLTVQFTGNGQATSAAIDESRTFWDFDISDSSSIDATTRNATHTYVVSSSNVQTFIARLTMYDVDGNPGSAEVAIRVEGSTGAGDMGGGDDGQSDIRIQVQVPGSVDSDVSSGTSPFEVELSVDVTEIEGTLQSVVWDLGDGTTATSLVVPHTYVNQGDDDQRIPITATVTTRMPDNSTRRTVATRVITVRPGSGSVNNPDPSLPGAGIPPGSGQNPTALCGMGMLPVVLFSCLWMVARRRRD